MVAAAKKGRRVRRPARTERAGAPAAGAPARTPKSTSATPPEPKGDSTEGQTPPRQPGSALTWVFVSCLSVAPFAPLLASHKSFDYANLPHALFLTVTTLAVLTAWCAVGARQGRLHVRRSPFDLPVLAFVAWSGLSLLWCPNRYEGFTLWVHWAVCALVFFLSRQMISDQRHRQLLFRGLLISGTTVALIGIAQRNWGLDIIQQAAPPASTFGNRNHAAQYIVIALPAALATLLCGTRRRFVQILVALVVVAELVFVYYTKAKGAWLAVLWQLAFAVLLCLWVWCSDETSADRSRKRRRIALSLALCFAVGGAAVLPAIYVVSPAVQHSLDSRIPLWANSLAVFRQSPITGVGTNNWQIVYPRYARAVTLDSASSVRKSPLTPHNDYIHFVCEVGLVGTGLLLWLLIVLLRHVARLLRPGVQGHAAVAVAILVGVSGNACVSSPLHKAVPPAMVMCVLGLLAGLVPSETSLESEGRRRASGFVLGRPAAVPMTTVCALALVVCTIVGIRWHLADIHYGRLMSWSNRRQPDKALTDAVLARKYNPWRGTVRLWEGRCYLQKKEHQKAVDILEGMRAEFPYSYTLITNLSVAYNGLRQYDRALECAEEVIAYSSDPAAGYVLKGEALRQRGDREAASEAYRNAVEHGTEDAGALCNYGATAWELKNFEEAANAFLTAGRLAPELYQAAMGAGMLLAGPLGRPEEGVPHLKRALDLSPPEKSKADIERLLDKHAPESR